MPISPAVVSMLKTHKAAQAVEKLCAGNQWRESGLVFTTEFGGPVEPRNVLRTIEIAAARAGVRGRRGAAAAALRRGGVADAACSLIGGPPGKLPADWRARR